ncbi:MAG: hypothetical protein QME64_06520 [bacterium]|nr:hypothetical protein [bacterium]
MTTQKLFSFILCGIIFFILALTSWAGTAKIAWVHHGNQHISDNASLAGYHNSRPGYWATIDSHVYNNVPVDIHISGTLLQSYSWNQNDRGLLNALKSNNQIELVGSAYAQHILPYADEDMNIFALQYYKDLLTKSLAAPGTAGGNPTDRPILIWLPERVWKDFLLNDISQVYWRNPRSPIILLDDNVASQYGLNSHKIYKIESGLDRVYVAFICSIAREHWLDGDFSTNPSNALRVHLSQLANAADQDQICIYGDDWEKAAGIAGWWDATANYDANINYVKNNSGWLQPIHVSEAVEWWGGSAPTINIAYGAYQLLQDWTGGNYDYWHDDNLAVTDGRPGAPWGKESMRRNVFPYDVNTAIVPDWDGNGIRGTFMDLWRGAVGNATTGLRQNVSYSTSSPSSDSRTAIITNYNLGRAYSYPSEFGNPINQVGFITLMSQLYEIGWHNGTQNWMEGWVKNLHNHTRYAGAFARGAYWLEHLPPAGSPRVVASDFDGDGTLEYALENNKLCAIFDRRGGRALWVFTADSTVVIGNSMSNWGGEGDYDDGGHPGLFRDSISTHNLHNVSQIATTGGTVSITFNTGGISSKIISLSTTDSYLKIEYNTGSNTNWIMAGVSPDIKQLLDYGYSLSPSYGLSSNGWMYAGYTNMSTGVKSAFVWGSGQGYTYNDFGRMHSLANKIELGGKSGIYTCYFYAGKANPEVSAVGPGDQDGPVISNVTQNPAVNIMSYSTVTVTANVWDVSSVKNVWLRYGINSSWTYPDITMTQDTGGNRDWNNNGVADPSLYGGTLSPRPTGILVEYTIGASDYSNKTTWATQYGQNFKYRVGEITFVMDGNLDNIPEMNAVSNGSMHLWYYYYAQSSSLYVASEAAWNQTGKGYTNDHFIFVARNPGTLRSAPWAKSGQVATWDAYLAGESSNAYVAWSDVSPAYTSASTGGNTGVLEGTINLGQFYGSVPSVIHLAVGSYSTQDAGTLQWQVPAPVVSDGTIQASEYLAIRLVTKVEEILWKENE